MNIRIDQLTKGLLTLAVILMFAAALVADQARANLPQDVATAEFTSASRTGILLDADALRNINAMSDRLANLFSLPVALDLCADLLTPDVRDPSQDESQSR